MRIMNLPAFRMLLLLTFFSLMACRSDEPAIIYLVRHAEKDLADTSENPALTTEGLARAERLKAMLLKEPVTAIYSTSFDRNILTVKPLAEAKKVDVLLYEWHNWQPMLRKVRRTGRGKTQVICGHGDNLLPMIEFLDGTPPLDSLGSYEYDKIFRVERQSDTTLVSVIRY